MPLHRLRVERPPHLQAFFNEVELAGSSTKRLLVAIANHSENVPEYFLHNPPHLMRFCRSARAPVIKALCEVGVDFVAVQAKCKELHSLGQAFYNKDAGAFRTLIEHGLDPNQVMTPKDYQKRSVLMRCVHEDKVDLFVAMLDAKVDSDLPHKAIANKAMRCVEQLCLRDRAYIKKPQVQELAQDNPQFDAFIQSVTLDRETPQALPSSKRMRL
jgi:hypothetical protein